MFSLQTSDSHIGYCDAHCWSMVVFHAGYGWQEAPCTGLRVLSEFGLDVGVAALLASVAPLYKMVCILHQS